MEPRPPSILHQLSGFSETLGIPQGVRTGVSYLSSITLQLEHNVFKMVTHISKRLTNYFDLLEVTCLISGYSPSWAKTQSCSKLGLVNQT